MGENYVVVVIKLDIPAN